jgi:tetratricopeptide (TPR) repeat protein
MSRQRESGFNAYRNMYRAAAPALSGVAALTALVVLASCSPVLLDLEPQPANPIEVLDKSPRMYSIVFELLADSVDTERAAAYLRGGVDHEVRITRKALAAISDSTLYAKLSPREAAELEYYKAKRRYDAGAEQAASYHLKRAMAADKTYRPPYLLLGRMLVARGGLEQAHDLYATVLGWDNADSDALVGLARCELRMGNIARAQAALVDAVIYNRANLGAWSDLEGIAQLRGMSVSNHDAPELGLVRKERGRHYRIVIDDSLKDCPVGATAWIAFASERAVWQYEGKYKRRFGGSRYVLTYEEDVDCYTVLAAAWKTLVGQDSTAISSQDSTACDTAYLEYLGKVAEDGYLVSHVLFDYVCIQAPGAARYFSDEVLARLRDYVNTYVIVPRGQS